MPRNHWQLPWRWYILPNGKSEATTKTFFPRARKKAQKGAKKPLKTQTNQIERNSDCKTNIPKCPREPTEDRRSSLMRSLFFSTLQLKVSFLGKRKKVKCIWNPLNMRAWVLISPVTTFRDDTRISLRTCRRQIFPKMSAPDILGYAKQSYEQKLQDLSGKQKLFRRISNDAWAVHG